MIYRHVRTKKLYKLLYIGLLESTLEEVVVYEGFDTKQVWVRPKEEFFDGRFVKEDKV